MTRIRIYRAILSVATVALAGATAFAGVIVHVGRVFTGSTADSEFWLLAELAALSVGPLVLGAFLLAALWLRSRRVAMVALAAVVFCLCAALVIAAKESFLEMAPVLLYAVALIAYFGAAVRQAPSTPGEPG